MKIRVLTHQTTDSTNQKGMRVVYMGRKGASVKERNPSEFRNVFSICKEA